MPQKKVELLAPAGNMEKLKIAIHYGADAVYLAGKDFSLRNYSGNFTDEELKKATTYAHEHDVKVYVACNIYARDTEISRVPDFLNTIARTKADAVIISDPGIIRLARESIPDIPIHLSTQANTTNSSAVRFWQDMGVTRVNLARELSLAEIVKISHHSDMETEVFIHGAMCISYSGRCLLSSIMTGRDSNRGLCSHPCRWQYAVVEEQRPHEYHPISQDSRGTYIFNSKDLCMIDYMPQLLRSGVTSLKIEGRMKGIHYLSAVVKTYREAIDSFLNNPDQYAVCPEWHAELSRVYHREYGTGFYFDSEAGTSPNHLNITRGDIHGFIGKILSVPSGTHHLVEIRNRIRSGDTVTVLSASGPAHHSKILAIATPDGQPLIQAQPNTRAILTLDRQFSPNDMVRRA